MDLKKSLAILVRLRVDLLRPELMLIFSNTFLNFYPSTPASHSWAFGERHWGKATSYEGQALSLSFYDFLFRGSSILNSSRKSRVLIRWARDRRTLALNKTEEKRAERLPYVNSNFSSCPEGFRPKRRVIVCRKLTASSGIFPWAFTLTCPADERLRRGFPTGIPFFGAFQISPSIGFNEWLAHLENVTTVTIIKHWKSRYSTNFIWWGENVHFSKK